MKDDVVLFIHLSSKTKVLTRKGVPGRAYLNVRVESHYFPQGTIPKETTFKYLTLFFVSRLVTRTSKRAAILSSNASILRGDADLERRLNKEENARDAYGKRRCRLSAGIFGKITLR